MLRQRRRVTRIVLLALLLATGGAIVNVAVAWGIANSIDSMSPNHEVISPINSPSNWYVARHKTKVSLCVMGVINLHSADALHVTDSRVPNWSRIKNLPSYTEGERMPMLYDFAFGWPFLSMWYAFDAERDWQSGTVISRVTLGGIEEFGLPLRILWPGFAINTVFYAAVLWMVFAMPFVASRRRRIKRGLCPACAYPVGTSPVCTECGALLPLPP